MGAAEVDSVAGGPHDAMERGSAGRARPDSRNDANRPHRRCSSAQCREPASGVQPQPQPQPHRHDPEPGTWRAGRNAQRANFSTSATATSAASRSTNLLTGITLSGGQRREDGAQQHSPGGRGVDAGLGRQLRGDRATRASGMRARSPCRSCTRSRNRPSWLARAARLQAASCARGPGLAGDGRARGGGVALRIAWRRPAHVLRRSTTAARRAATGARSG